METQTASPPDKLNTLLSLQKVDDHPLYTMTFYGTYDLYSRLEQGASQQALKIPAGSWACSLFTALADPDNPLFGRNFDWDPSPALLLFTHPTDGYASVSMVDIAYLGFTGAEAEDLTSRPLDELNALLEAPYLPFDGMNAAGLAIGMAAVPEEDIPFDPAKTTVDSLLVMRLILDRAATVEEAVAILRAYNLDWGSGPAVHYLIADSSGKAVLVEFTTAGMAVMPAEQPYELATNFMVSRTNGHPGNFCWRYDRIERVLMDAGGSLTAQAAMALLQDVAQPSTQWSIIYEMSRQQIDVVMGGQFDTLHMFKMPQDSH
jgi:hypothetical protein